MEFIVVLVDLSESIVIARAGLLVFPPKIHAKAFGINLEFLAYLAKTEVRVTVMDAKLDQ